MSDSYTADLASFLDEALRAHGVDATREGDVLVLARSGVRVSAAIVSEQSFATHASVQLDVRVAIGPGRTLVESCAGIGNAIPAAIKNAKRSFVANALHVLLGAFGNVSGDQVTVEEWESGGNSFRAVVGNMTGRGEPPEGGPPTAWFAQVKAAVRNASLLPRTHWLRVYVARTAGPDHVTEVLLDNEPWPDLAARIAAFPWPETSGFYSVRTFLVLDGGFDTSRAVAVMHRLAERPDEEVVRTLVSLGADPLHAEKLVDFLPIAFGRQVLGRLGVHASDEGVLVTGGAERTFRLMDDPVFADASTLAAEAYVRGSMNPEIFKSLVMRGAELRAVNQALHGGSDAKNLLLSPPRFSSSAS